MNRKKLNKIIVVALTTAIISNVFIPVTAGAMERNSVNLELLGEEATTDRDDMNEKVLLDEKFDKEVVEESAEFKSWWENQIRPFGWQLRKWKGAAATGENTPSGKIIKDESFAGGAYVDVNFNNSVGFFQPDEYLPVAANTDYNFSVKLKKNNISSKEPVTIRAEFYDEGKSVVERSDLVKLSGTGEWETINRVVKTTKGNAKYLKIIFIFGNVSSGSVGATGGISIDNMKLSSKESLIERVEFAEKEIMVPVGRSYKPSLNVFPAAATEGYKLESKDSTIATVDGDRITGVLKGETEVIAKSDSGKVVGSVKVKVEEVNTAVYDKALNSIFETMVPNSIIDKNDSEIMNIVKGIENTANKHWNSMNKSASKNGLWKDAESTTNSAHVTTQFNRLYDMTLAYVMEGSSLKGNEDLLNDILSGIKWLKDNRYDGKKFYNNWWDWEIGAPQKLNSILILLRDKMSYDDIVQYTDIIDKYVKDPTKHTQGKYPSVGGNRADMCKVVIYSGLLSGNDERIKLGVKEMDILFEYVDDIVADGRPKTDGYYKDGSWVEHKNIPYAGTYGAILMGGVGEIVHVLNDTPWEIPDSKVNIMYDVILQSFEPLIYKGVMMNMVSGRSISRDNELDYGHGFGAMRRILAFYTESAPEAYKNRFKAMIKQWISSNDVRDIIGKSTNLQFTVQAKQLMADESIKPRGELIGNYVFANMDRAVHRRPGYVFGVSMYSNRIANYESLNGENLKGYHTSDGMTYLYNGDIEQYAKDFWPTVDSKRLPGTTVDTKDIFKNVAGQNYGPGESATSERSWVGGATLGDFGVVGMHLDNKRANANKDLGMDLQGKKSYFMFDDEIVALGSGITSTKDNGVETTIENRIINGDKDKIYVNGKEVTKDIENVEKKLEASTIYLEGDSLDKSIGYYIPNSKELNFKKETRTGSWKEINNGKSDAKKSNTFFTLWNDHGVNPENDKYEYVIIPNISKEKLESYEKKSDIEIIDNNENIQAVKEKNKGITAANFWSKDGGKTTDGYISSTGESSVITKKIGNEVEVAVSDPTMKNKGVVTIELDENFKGILSNDERVTVEGKDGKTILKVNVNKQNGATIKVKLKVGEKIANWTTGVSYKIGDIVTFQGIDYQCIQNHNSMATWEPNVATSLWKIKQKPVEGNNWGAEINYKVGDVVVYEGNEYQCIQAHYSIVTWEPTVATSLWKLKK